MEWTDESIARLKQLWAEGLSTAEIGRRMGISKNAVVGKAHRLLLTSRPSPIRRDAEGRPSRPAAPRRVTGPTLPSLAAAPAPPRSAAAEPAPQPAPTAHAPSAPAPATHAPAGAALRQVSVAPIGAERRRNVACCWPIGEPGTRSFRFCDEDSVHGKPYCQAHVALAYVKIRDRREDAA